MGEGGGDAVDSAFERGKEVKGLRVKGKGGGERGSSSDHDSMGGKTICTGTLLKLNHFHDTEDA